MVRMGRDFLCASKLPVPFDAAWADRSLAGHMDRPDGLALVLDLGAEPCGMLIGAQIMSPLAPVRVANELVFWIDPPARGRWATSMIRAYEDWARGQGCAMASLATVATKSAGRLYERCGYAPAEHHFMKAF
jgi:GNAT superfamily N-acetyltransferase